MTKKQMKKFAQQIYECEQIHKNSSSLKEIERAENQIMSITNQIMSEPNGLDLLNQIDELIQQKYN